MLGLYPELKLYLPILVNFFYLSLSCPVFKLVVLLYRNGYRYLKMFTLLCKKCFYIHRIFPVSINIHWVRIWKELLKFEIRLCVDMKILAMKKQAELSGLMDSIGKQITGWRNANR